MRAYKCDICKQFYDGTAFDTEARTDPFTGEPIAFERKRLAVCASIDLNNIRFSDACPSCMAALQTVCKRIEKEGYEWIK